MNTLWSRIHALLLNRSPMTSRDIATAVDADPRDVRNALYTYANRGKAVRVVIRDNPRMHWRLAVRDPRRDPAVGDVLQRRDVTRSVVAIERRPCGALHKVHGPRGLFWHAATWHAWALDGAEVVQRGVS